MSHNQANGHARPNPSSSTANGTAVQGWDPAALLNPKSYAAGAQNSNRNPASQPAQAVPTRVAYRFDGPSHSSQSKSAEPEAVGDRQGRGVGSMLEQLHKVEEREVPYLKRKRIEEDEIPSEITKAEFTGGGKSGILGQHFKEQKEKAQLDDGNVSVANQVAVDLTGGDEEDVVVLGDAKDTEVCYGRVDTVTINAFKVPTPKPGARSISDRMWPPIKIVLKRRVGDRSTCIHAADASRTTIGCLDVNTSIALAPLLDSKLGIRTASRILARPKSTNDPPAGADTSTRYSLDLVLYGPRKHAVQVGRFLSQKQVWLRQPLMVEAGIELCNPHHRENMEAARKALASRTNRGTSQVRSVEEVRNDVIGMFDSMEKTEDLPEKEPDDTISTPLLRHQKQALYFMTSKEKAREPGSEVTEGCTLWRPRISHTGQHRYYNVITGEEQPDCPPKVRGGILADMMGLGKTLSILSLISNSLAEAEAWSKCQPPPQQGESVKPTLNARSTLLVSPLSTISNWEEQLKQHIKPGGLTYYVYHGSGRIKDVEKLADFDIVITTYGSISSEFSNRSKKKKGTFPLEEINWFRIVLDEAHMIREQSTLQSKAVCRLNAQRRWAVTGTPVQNRLDDLGALLKFLRVKPFDEKERFAQYILGPCRIADPDILPKLRLLVASITLRRLKDKINLPPRSDRLVKLQFSPEEREIYNIFQQNASAKVTAITGQRTKSLGGRTYVHILQAILRLRLICAHGRDLLSEHDLKLLEGLSKASAIELDSDDEDDAKPALTSFQVYDTYRLMKETNADTCISCNARITTANAMDIDESKDEIIAHMSPCYHLICNSCIKHFRKTCEETSQDGKRFTCGFCGSYNTFALFPLRLSKMEEDHLQEDCGDKGRTTKQLGNYTGPHTKTKALIRALKDSELMSEANPDEPPIKSVVFSTWTSHLDLIQLAFEMNQISYTRLDGKMTRTARTQALDKFRDDPSIRVILVSITAGGLGLNLTTANKVYVMEPQYNPALEAQAVDRVHRLGQKRAVETTRFIMDESFEEKMIQLQEKKRRLATLSMDSHGGRGAVDKKEVLRRRLEELKDLFK